MVGDAASPNPSLAAQAWDLHFLGSSTPVYGHLVASTTRQGRQLYSLAASFSCLLCVAERCYRDVDSLSNDCASASPRTMISFRPSNARYTFTRDHCNYEKCIFTTCMTPLLGDISSTMLVFLSCFSDEICISRVMVTARAEEDLGWSCKKAIARCVSGEIAGNSLAVSNHSWYPKRRQVCSFIHLTQTISTTGR